jgi:FkbM family methyltransferase
MEGLLNIMTNTITKLKDVLSWLTYNNVVGPWPFFDRVVFLLRRMRFVAVKIAYRMVIGKERRDQLYTKRHLREDWSPSYKIVKAFFKILKLFKITPPQFIQIIVPEYNYKFYVRLDKEDLATYENAIFQLFRPKQKDNFIDVGAHIGRYSIMASKRIGSSDRVIAIEAHPDTFELLKKNIKLNALHNVTTINSVVTSQKGKVKLYLPGQDSGFTVYNTIMINRAKPTENFLEVEANTLDNILDENNIQRVNYLKIDVEGAELEVLKGAVNTLSSNKDLTLLIEVHGDANYKPILEIFEEYKFQIIYENKYYPSNDRHIIAKKIPYEVQQYHSF